jgi:uncharacterized protein YdeI (YjbR/CyaY-like superfamily)
MTPARRSTPREPAKRRNGKTHPHPGRPAVDADGTTYFATPEDFGAWLTQHGAERDLLWVGFHRQETGVPSMTWHEAVDEALGHGWIDGVRQRVDEHGRYRQRFTPRRPGSNWSKRNVDRVEALTAEGRMTAAGRAAFEARDGRVAPYSFERDQPAVLPPEYQRRLEANEDAWTFFQAQPPGYRNISQHWVMSAKREETRERRLQTLIDDAANGLRIKLLRRP